MALLPPIGTSGIYLLNSPFASQLQPNIAYRCEAVRKLSDLIEAGVDPFEEIYQPNGISQQSYEQDVANQACIVSLQSSTGHWVYVPSTYIKSFPNVNGVPYRVMVLGVELGPIPEYMDLGAVKSAVAQTVRDVLGVTPTIKEVAISPVQNFSQNDHDVIESNRAAQIANSDTWKAKYLAAQNSLEELQRQYNVLAGIARP